MATVGNAKVRRTIVGTVFRGGRNRQKTVVTDYCVDTGYCS